MKIKREILAKLLADLAKIVFATLVVGKFVSAEFVTWQVFNVSCLVFLTLIFLVWFAAPREQVSKRRKKS